MLQIWQVGVCCRGAFAVLWLEGHGGLAVLLGRRRTARARIPAWQLRGEAGGPNQPFVQDAEMAVWLWPGLDAPAHAGGDSEPISCWHGASRAASSVARRLRHARCILLVEADLKRRATLDARWTPSALGTVVVMAAGRYAGG